MACASNAERNPQGWLALFLFLAAISGGLLALLGAGKAAKKSRALMWKIREEGIRRGQVPYPADALPPTREDPLIPNRNPAQDS